MSRCRCCREYYEADELDKDNICIECSETAIDSPISSKHSFQLRVDYFTATGMLGTDEEVLDWYMSDRSDESVPTSNEVSQPNSKYDRKVKGVMSMYMMSYKHLM